MSCTLVIGTTALRVASCHLIDSSSGIDVLRGVHMYSFPSLLRLREQVPLAFGFSADCKKKKKKKK